MILQRIVAAFVVRAIACIVAFVALVATRPILAQAAEPASATATEATPKIPNDQLDSLVAPIALYPDPLLAQILAASTYPLEIAQLEQWLKRNPNLKQDALAKEVAKQPWDSSVQGLAIYPELVTRLSENIAWTMDLGNAFLGQQSDVLAAVQRMRAKAQSKGTLKTTEQQTVETEPVEGGVKVITIEPTNPQYAYVPSYDMSVVYGPPIYPWPPYYYPGYAPGMGLAFGTGIILGAAWANHWGDCDWHHGGDVTINNKNNFNRNNINNINGGNRNQTGGGKWQHNPSHRGGAPYGDRGTANKYGGRARQQPAGGAANRGGSLAGNRPGGASGVAGGAGSGTRPNGGPGGSGAANRPAGGGGHGGIGPNRADGTNVLSGANRTGGGSGSFGENAFSKNAFGDRAGGGGNRAGASTLPANRGGAMSSNGIGNRSVSSGSALGSSSTVFGGEQSWGIEHGRWRIQPRGRRRRRRIPRRWWWWARRRWRRTTSVKWTNPNQICICLRTA
jgi:hypothetical protein